MPHRHTGAAGLDFCGERRAPSAGLEAEAKADPGGVFLSLIVGRRPLHCPFFSSVLHAQPLHLPELPALRGSIWDCVHSWNINAKLCLLWRMLIPSKTKDHPPLVSKGLSHRGPLSLGWVPCVAYHGGVWQGCCSIMLVHTAKVLAVLLDLRMTLLTLPCPSLLIYKCKL